MLGSVGKKWRNPQLEVLLRDEILHRSYHCACADGVCALRQPAPSKASYLALTNIKFYNRKCRCKVPIEQHRLEWQDLPQESQGKLRQKSQS